jgi:hypothetical protein
VRRRGLLDLGEHRSDRDIYNRARNSPAIDTRREAEISADLSALQIEQAADVARMGRYAALDSISRAIRPGTPRICMPGGFDEQRIEDSAARATALAEQLCDAQRTEQPTHAAPPGSRRKDPRCQLVNAAAGHDPFGGLAGDFVDVLVVRVVVQHDCSRGFCDRGDEQIGQLRSAVQSTVRELSLHL